MAPKKSAEIRQFSHVTLGLDRSNFELALHRIAVSSCCAESTIGNPLINFDYLVFSVIYSGRPQFLGADPAALVAVFRLPRRPPDGTFPGFCM
jgi:hypothetical protein